MHAEGRALTAGRVYLSRSSSSTLCRYTQRKRQSVHVRFLFRGLFSRSRSRSRSRCPLPLPPFPPFLPPTMTVSGSVSGGAGSDGGAGRGEGDGVATTKIMAVVPRFNADTPKLAYGIDAFSVKLTMAFCRPIQVNAAKQTNVMNSQQSQQRMLKAAMQYTGSK